MFRLGLDEAAVDISAEVGNRLAAGANVQNFSGHTIGAAEGETCTGPSTMVSQSEQTPDIVLMLASHLVSEIRVAVERETGFCLSCGISDNVRVFVCSSLHTVSRTFAISYTWITWQFRLSFLGLSFAENACKAGLLCQQTKQTDDSSTGSCGELSISTAC